MSIRKWTRRKKGTILGLGHCIHAFFLPLAGVHFFNQTESHPQKKYFLCIRILWKSYLCKLISVLLVSDLPTTRQHANLPFYFIHWLYCFSRSIIFLPAIKFSTLLFLSELYESSWTSINIFLIKNSKKTIQIIKKNPSFYYETKTAQPQTKTIFNSLKPIKIELSYKLKTPAVLQLAFYWIQRIKERWRDSKE